MRKAAVSALIASILVLLLIPPLVSNGTIVKSVTLSESGTISYNQPSSSGFTIFQSGGTCYIENSAGSNVYSSSNVYNTFTEAFNLVSSGGSVTVNPGTYTAGQTIFMTSCTDVTLTFQAGAVLTIVNNIPPTGSGGSLTDTSVLVMTSCSDCSFVNLDINGNAQNQAQIPLHASGAYSSGIVLCNCNGCTFTGATIANCVSMGFIIYDSAVSTQNGISDSTITFCGANCIQLGEDSTYSQNDYALNNVCEYCGDVGISDMGVGDRIIGNYVYDMNGTQGYQNSQWGIASETNGYCTFEGNTIVGAQIGLVYTGSYPNLALGNTISQCVCGIDDSGAGYDTFTQNHVTNWGSDPYSTLSAEDYATGGIFDAYSTQGYDIISFNTLTGGGSTAVVSEMACNAIVNNAITLSGSGLTGIQVAANSNLAEGNTVQATTGITVSGSGNRVFSNSLAGCQTQVSNGGSGTVTAFANPAVLTLNCPSCYGSVSMAAGSYSESASSQVTITLTPNANYNAILNVDGANATLTGNSYTLSMSSDHVVYVIFYD